MSENRDRMLRGELYHAFTPELIYARARCVRAINNYNNAGDITRRRRVELWRKIVQDETEMPPILADADDDAAQFDATDPWVEPPLRADYGFNIKAARGTFINYNATFVDTCRVTIGARTLVGPNVSFFAGGHPLDPDVRQGTQGPEFGKEITIGEDCWIGGNVTVLPGVTVGRGAVVGAASVVTKDVAALTVVAGNPARVIRKIVTAVNLETSPDETLSPGATEAGAGVEILTDDTSAANG